MQQRIHDTEDLEGELPVVSDECTDTTPVIIPGVMSHLELTASPSSPAAAAAAAAAPDASAPAGPADSSSSTPDTSSSQKAGVGSLAQSRLHEGHE